MIRYIVCLMLATFATGCYVETERPPIPRLGLGCGDDPDEGPEVCGPEIGACPSGGVCTIRCQADSDCPDGAICNTDSVRSCQYACADSGDCPDPDVATCDRGMCFANPAPQPSE